MPLVLSSTTTQATCAFIVNMKCQLQRTRLKIKDFILFANALYSTVCYPFDYSPLISGYFKSWKKSVVPR